MAGLSITGQMKVSTLQEGFLKEFGLTLRVYDGRAFADPTQTLAQVRKKKGSGKDLSVAKNMKVGNLEDKFEEEFGLKVQVAGSDDSYLCKDELTLNAAQQDDEKKLARKERKAARQDEASDDGDGAARQEASDKREAMIGDGGKYEFHIQMRIANGDFTEEETVFETKMIGDDAEGVVEGLRAEWKKHMQTIEQKNEKGDDEYSLYIDCEEIIRLSDGASYFDDEGMPQGPDVSDNLLDLLDEE
jgi:hypothetical protein